ncbi:MAG: DUF3570 domain-containing protein [Candidatus Thiodiazotropha sp.]
MQLKDKYGDIRGALALAVCSTLHGTAHAADEISDQWELDSAFLYYSEKDRVDVYEPVLFASKQLSESESVTLHGVFDTMSGATPNGAIKSSTAQTFTSASGNAYTTTANELPTMDFEDDRFEFGFEWDKNTSRQVKRTLGGNLSAEGDYSSLGGSLSYAFDSMDRMRTLSVGGGFSYDKVDPEGGTPTAFSLMSDDTTVSKTSTSNVDTITASSGGSSSGGIGIGSGSGSSSSSSDGDSEDSEESSAFSLFDGERKLKADLLLGVTQILSRQALMQLNYTLNLSDGYLNDPYKVVSLVDSSGEPTDAVFEKRPDQRAGNALLWKLVYHLPRDVMHLSYRYYWDDWGIKSHTADLSYRMALWGDNYLQPHIRYYNQTKADFYYSALSDSTTLPDYATADYRMAEMTSTTAGLKLGIPTGAHGEWSLRAEVMKQRGTGYLPDTVTGLAEDDLFPDLDAIIFQISYTEDF